MILTPQIKLTRILGTSAELNALQGLLDRIDLETRDLIGEPESRHLFAMLPSGKSPHDKFLYGIYLNDELIGCLDLIHGFPDLAYVYVGLFVLDKSHRGYGLGRECWHLTQEMIRSWGGIKRVRLGVTVGNALAEKFWRSMGFLPTGETSISCDNGNEQLCSIYEKALVPSMMSIYERDENRLSDTEFEPGQLDHIAVGNKGRLLDPRRTPMSVVDILSSLGMFVIRIEGFEDKGAIWEVPFEDVLHYQFFKEAKRINADTLAKFKKTVERFDKAVKIECDPESRSDTLQSLKTHCQEAFKWLESHSSFFAKGGKLPDPEERVGDVFLRDDLLNFLREKNLLDLENDFARQFVSNPHAGEIIKGHRIVLAELGLIAYKGKIQRNPDLFSGKWSRERRKEHILWRMSFVQSVFRKLGIAKVCLYRGMSYHGNLQPPRNQSFVSTTFSKMVAESHLDAGSADIELSGVLFRQWVPIERLFMTCYETERMNLFYKEVEAVLLYDENNNVF